MPTADGPSQLEVAAPFFITAGLTALSGLGALLVVRRMKDEYQQILDEADLPERSRIIDIRAASLAGISNWAIDGASLVASLLGPGIGLALLYDDLAVKTIVIYSLVMFAALGGFFLFVDKVPVRGYPNRAFGVRVRRIVVGPRSVGPLTPMVVVAILVNVVAGLMVWRTGP